MSDLSHGEPIHLPLSVYQSARLKRYATEAQRLLDHRNEALATIIAGALDPATIAHYLIDVTDTSVVLTPPPPATDRFMTAQTSTTDSPAVDQTFVGGW